jgi:plasmid stability protein
MKPILIRGLDDEAMRRLKQRAKNHGRSLAAEAKAILLEAAASPEAEPKVDMERARRMAEKIREQFKGRKFPDTVTLLREGKD